MYLKKFKYVINIDFICLDFCLELSNLFVDVMLLLYIF